VDVVFDMAGGAVFDASYAVLAHFGRIVVCGIATQEPNEVRTGSLLRHSRSVVGFYLFHCLERPWMVSGALSDLFARATRGELRTIIGGTYPLAAAAQAHADLRARRTTGKLLLDPAA
jgi:NADPH2:quinone reductase